MLLFDRSQPLRDQVERFFPRGFTKAALMPNQWALQPILAIHKVPAEFAFHASGDLIGLAMQWNNLQNMTIARPNIVATADTAIRADSLRAFDAFLAHFCFGLG